MAKAILSIASKNYGSWSLRGWLLCKMSGLDFEEQQVSADDPSNSSGITLVVALVPRAMPYSRRPDNLGHVGDRGISPRNQSRCEVVSYRSGAARPLPLDLWAKCIQVSAICVPRFQ